MLIPVREKQGWGLGLTPVNMEPAATPASSSSNLQPQPPHTLVPVLILPGVPSGEQASGVTSASWAVGSDDVTGITDPMATGPEMEKGARVLVPWLCSLLAG